MFRDATRAVTLVAAAMATAEFDAGRLEARAAEGWTTLTELADTLVRDDGLPFRKAHQIAAGLMAARKADAAAPLSALLAGVSRDLLGSPLQYTDDVLAKILSPRHFVDVRKTAGGPAPEETARAIAASRRQLDADREAWQGAADALAAARGRLASRSAAL
jgi:argininosuccinate lyase